MMSKPSVTNEALEKRLVDFVATYADDPLGYSKAAYKWGTGDLTGSPGPRAWQADILGTIAKHLQNPATRFQPLRIAVASGHGIGKSGLIGMICQWAMSTCVDTKIVVTANTDTQLRTKTMPEITKWFREAINAHWFGTTATTIHSTTQGKENSWKLTAAPWSENSTEAFAGLHNLLRRIVLIYDEASGISDKIWEVSEGAQTDENTEIMWIAFSNPTRNTGRFRECFGRLKHRWVTRQIDSRKVEGTNKQYFQEIVEDNGEDSDYTRVRVKGEFPRYGTMQFIGSDLVEAARARLPESSLMDPCVLGVDVARFGSDETVLCPRRGRDAKSMPWESYRGKDTMFVAARVMELHAQYGFDAIFVDGGGVGSGVIDRLRMFHLPVIEVQFGGAPDRGIQTSEGKVVYANKRAEMWGNLRDALKYIAIPDDADLATQLVSVEYSYILREGRDAVILEKKLDMKKRGLESPDKADALCLVAGTVVSTPSGDKKIEDFIVGDEVITPFGVTRVSKTWESHTDKITSVKFSDGKTLSGKGDHKIFTWGDGQLTLDALSFTNEIATINQWNLSWWMLRAFITKGSAIEFRQAVDTISLEGKVTPSAFFIGVFGQIITEKYQKTTLYITKTATGAIMKFQISKLCLSLNTAGCTLPSICDEKILEEKLLTDKRKLSSKQPSGTNPKMEENGILNTPVIIGKMPKPKPGVAKFAKRTTKLIWETLSIALRLARNTSVIADILRIKEIARGVVKSFSPIVTGLQSVVPVSVESEERSRTPVYNLTLEKHNAYYANGVLVYNCLTYAYPVMPTNHSSTFDNRSGDANHTYEYNPLSREKASHGAPEQKSYNPLRTR